MPQSVLFFADKLWPNIGGMETHAEYFIKYFRESQNFPLTGVVTFNEHQIPIIKYEEIERPFDFNCKLLETASIVFHNSGKWICDMEQLKKRAPNALHVYRTGGNEIIKAELPLPSPENHKERQSKWVDIINANINLMITNSVFTEKRLRDQGIKIPFLYTPGGVAPVTHHAQIKDSKLIKLFCAARFVPYKNHRLLIQVIDLLLKTGINLELKLAGDGPLLEECLELTKQIGNRNPFIFLGKISNEQVIEEIQKSDYYIQFSTDLVTEVRGGSYIHTEGMGRSILEAISNGVFVIALEAGALTEFITPNRGILIPYGPAYEIAEKLIPVLRNKPSKLKPTNEYSWDNVFKKYTNYWLNGN